MKPFELQTVITGCMLAFFILFPYNAMAQQLTIYTEESQFAHYADANGYATGYVADLVKEIQKRVRNYDPINIVPWERGYMNALKKPNVLLFSTTYTQERHPFFKWIGPVGESVWALMASADSKVVIKNLDSARKGVKIGTYSGDVREEYLKKCWFTNLDSVSDNRLNLQKLLEGRIDLWAASEKNARQMCKEEGIDFSKLKTAFELRRHRLFLTFNKKTSDNIVGAWREAFKKIRADGTMKAIYKKYGEEVPDYQGGGWTVGD